MNNRVRVVKLANTSDLSSDAFDGLSVRLAPRIPYNLIRRVRHPHPSPPLCVENYDYVMRQQRMAFSAFMNKTIQNDTMGNMAKNYTYQGGSY